MTRTWWWPLAVSCALGVTAGAVMWLSGCADSMASRLTTPVPPPPLTAIDGPPRDGQYHVYVQDVQLPASYGGQKLPCLFVGSAPMGETTGAIAAMDCDWRARHN